MPTDEPTSPPAIPSPELASSEAAESEKISSTAAMTPAELAEAKRYGGEKLRCEIGDQLLDLAYLGVAAVVLALPLDRWLATFISSAALRLAALFVLITLGHEVFSFPLSYFSGYVLEHRYQLSHQSRLAWVGRHFKQFGLAIVLGLVMFEGLYGIIWSVGSWWWLCAAGVFFVVSVLLSQLMPVLILPLFYKIEPLEDAELSERMRRLTAGTGLSIEGVYRMGLSAETAKANAMLAGLGHTRRVLMGDTLLDQFTPDEIDVIFAHEIGHHVHRHIRKLILAGVVSSVGAFWLCNWLVASWVEWQEGARVAAQDWPVWTLPMVMWVVTAFFMLLGPLQNLLSRRFERQCDRYALARTGNRPAYVSAFRKLARLNKDDPEPSALEVFLFHSHPPIAERLALADE